MKVEVTKFLVCTQALILLYFAINKVNDSLGPGWAFISLLTLVFLAAVILEKGVKNVTK